MRLAAADFAGTWRLSRRIDDARAGQVGLLEGRAVLTPVPGGLRYDEAGTLRYGAGPPLQALRRYLWAFAEGAVEVAFDDGRPFHRFVPEGRAAGTDHPCGADHYRVAYDFDHWPDWQATWRVTGPAKDYVLVSRYARDLHGGERWGNQGATVATGERHGAGME